MKILLASAAIAALALTGCSHDKKMMKDEAAAESAATPSEPVADDTTVDTATQPGDPNANPGVDSCYEKGGAVVQWYDADGESIDACRMEDGSEMSISDMLTYGG